MIRIAPILLCLALSTPATEGEPTVVDGPLGKKLDAMLSRYAQYGLSATVLAAKDRHVVLHKGYGLADRERRIANSADTLFEMGSITKTFTAAALLRLEMDGKLHTADRVSQHLGEFPGTKAGVTLDHLLTHKGGLQVEGSDLHDDGQDRDQFVEAMKKTVMESAPGERYRYTNSGYSVLAAVVEKVSAQPFETFVRQTLLAPAGMTSSGFRGDFAAGNRRIAKGYLGSPDRGGPCDNARHADRRQTAEGRFGPEGPGTSRPHGGAASRNGGDRAARALSLQELRGGRRVDDPDDGTHTRAPEPEDVIRICRALNDARARYVLIGGFAVIAHGAGRFTKDIDLLVDDAPENVARLKEGLRGLPDNAAADIALSDVREYVVVRVADEVMIDLMGRACGLTYSDVASDAEEIDLGGVLVPVASPRTLIRTKDTRRPQDAIDRAFLEGVLRERERKP